jgi:ferredoxin, 2Fe-2S
MPTIKVLPHPELCPDGAEFQPTQGITLCTALIDANIGIEHACDQSLACTTCHVIVRAGFNSTGEMSEDEEDLLDRAWGLTSLSRLSCQVKIGDQNLTVELPKYTINHARENH